MREDPPLNPHNEIPLTGVTVRLAVVPTNDRESQEARRKLWAAYERSAQLIFAYEMNTGRWLPHLTRSDQDDLANGFLLHFFGDREPSDVAPRVTKYDPTQGRFRDYFKQSAINYGTTQQRKARTRTKHEKAAGEIAPRADTLDRQLQECPDADEAILLGRVLAVIPQAMRRLAERGKSCWISEVPRLLSDQSPLDRDRLKTEMHVEEGTLRTRLNRLCNDLTPILEKLLRDTAEDDVDLREIVHAVFVYLGLRKFRRKGA